MIKPKAKSQTKHTLILERRGRDYEFALQIIGDQIKGENWTGRIINRSWSQKPSWHKLNHQNCAAAAACQRCKVPAACVRCAVVPFRTTTLPCLCFCLLLDAKKMDGCACVHALQGVSSLLLRNMPCRGSILLDRPLFSAPKEVAAAASTRKSCRFPSAGREPHAPRAPASAWLC